MIQAHGLGPVLGEDTGRIDREQTSFLIANLLLREPSCRMLLAHSEALAIDHSTTFQRREKRTIRSSSPTGPYWA